MNGLTTCKEKIILCTDSKNSKNSNGFAQVYTQKQIHKISISHTQNPLFDIPEDAIKRELAFKLGTYIIDKDLVSYYEKPDPFSKSLVAEINVASPGMKYANIQETVFTVDGEIFTNEELVKAVKECYAERFI